MLFGHLVIGNLLLVNGNRQLAINNWSLADGNTKKAIGNWTDQSNCSTSGQSGVSRQTRTSECLDRLECHSNQNFETLRLYLDRIDYRI